LSPKELLVDSVLCVWLALSVLVYVPRFRDIIRGRDLLSLIPEWRFFAPVPGQHDYHILYRDYYEGGEVDRWREIGVSLNRSFWCFLWNPKRRGKKALFDAVGELATHIQQGNTSPEMTMPYLTLLNHVSNVPRDRPAAMTQFMLMASEGTLGHADPAMMLISQCHRL